MKASSSDVRQQSEQDISNITLCQHYLVRIVNGNCLWGLRLFSSPIFLIWCLHRNPNHHNYWLSLGLCINLTTIIIASHVYDDIFKQNLNISPAIQITIIAFWSCMILFLFLDVNPPIPTDDENSKNPQVSTEAFELIQKKNDNDINMEHQQSMDDDDYLSAPVANGKNKKKRGIKPKIDAANPNQKQNHFVLGLKLSKPHENAFTLADEEQGYVKYSKYQRSLLGILMNDLKYIPDNMNQERIVFHYILMSIVISLSVGYVIMEIGFYVGFDRFEDDIGYMYKEDDRQIKTTITFATLYQILGIVLANLMGGYKIVELMVNWCMRKWKDPRIEEVIESHVSISTPQAISIL